MTREHLTAEERAIMRVVDAEIVAFFQRDFDAFQRCWAHDPGIRRLGWCTGGGINDVRGWGELKRLVTRLFEDHPEINPTAEDRDLQNLVVHVSGAMAFVTFDHYPPDSGDADVALQGFSREGRVLQLIDGAWRHIYFGYAHQTVEPIRAPMFRVDRKGSVGWMNQSAEKMIERGDTLKLIAGRLVARAPRDTQAIRVAIEQAADRDTKLAGGRACIPVLVQRDDEDAVCICWVVTEGAGSGAVLVSINNLTFAQDQLDAASAVFGLSRSQQRLAELITSGYDVVASSGLLGITANTAKTHLQRIFDKTGVRSQAALIRTLLSIDRPE